MRIGAIEEFVELEPGEDLSGPEQIRSQFPFPVVVECCYPELDVAIRWCWQQFGPRHGECSSQREYAACPIILETEYHDKVRDQDLKRYRDVPVHHHEGTWTTDWLGKTDYDHGYAVFFFSSEGDRAKFEGYVPEVTYGENYGFHRPMA